MGTYVQNKSSRLCNIAVSHFRFNLTGLDSVSLLAAEDLTEDPFTQLYACQRPEV